MQDETAKGKADKRAVTLMKKNPMRPQMTQLMPNTRIDQNARPADDKICSAEAKDINKEDDGRERRRADDAE
jgi:hypothetical protein